MLTKTNADFEDVTQDAHHSLAFFFSSLSQMARAAVAWLGAAHTQSVARKAGWLARVRTLPGI